MAKIDDVNKPTKGDAQKEKAKEGWLAHVRSEKRSAALAAGSFAALALLAGGLYVGLGPKPPPPKTAQQLMDERAKAVAADPDKALSGRVAPAFDPAKVAAAKGIIKPSDAPTQGVKVAKAAPMPASIGRIQALGAPSKELMDKAIQANGGKALLAVDAEGYATLPDGKRVKVVMGAPSVDAAKIKEAMAAKEQAQKSAAASAAILSNKGAAVDGNGNKKPMSLAEANEMASKVAAPGAPPKDAGDKQIDGSTGRHQAIDPTPPMDQNPTTTMK